MKTLKNALNYHMRQNFKRMYYSILADDSCMILLGAALLSTAVISFLLCGIRYFLLLDCLIRPLGIGSVWCWQQIGSVRCGRNFRIWPAMRRRCRLICQICNNPRSDCRQIRRSLAEDVLAMREILEQLPEGRKYQAITHDAVCRRLEASDDVVILRKQPAGERTLRHILATQTHGRCRHCRSRCAAWRSAPRQFYFIQFKIQH